MPEDKSKLSENPLNTDFYEDYLTKNFISVIQYRKFVKQRVFLCHSLNRNIINSNNKYEKPFYF